MRFKNQRARRERFARQFQRFATVVALLVLTVLFVSCWLDGRTANSSAKPITRSSACQPTCAEIYVTHSLWNKYANT